MWYQEGDVVVPGDEITMNGPNGEPDFFEKNGKKEDIFGVGIPSGKMIVMEPGKNYSFPGDLAVLESKKFPSFMMGGIPGVNGTVIGNTMMPTSTNKKRTKKYQIAGAVTNPSNNKIASELVPRFKVNNPLADEFVFPSLISLNIGQGSGTYNASVSQKMGPLTLTAKGTATKEKVQDYNVGANLSLFGPTKAKPNRPSLNITADYGKKTDETGNLGKAKFTPGINYKYAFKRGGKIKKILTRK
jgi:hypothetical protein